MTTRFSMLEAMLFFALLLATNVASAVDSISLQALFKDKAIIVVDGARRVLKSGEQSPEGVKLLATDTREEQAEIEIGGKREVLKLGVVTAGFASPGRGSVTLYPDRGGHFFVDGTINGAPVRFLVDTGATTIAMNGNTASRIGLDYRRLGRAGIASTAAGNVRTYNLNLGSVQVGDITLHNVPAGVIEGSHPTEVLLGMSFLGQLDLKQDIEKMELRER
ncbi:MAG: TIGR02281 family clan AA aspartic protease [Pseudomonadota bacterium]